MSDRSLGTRRTTVVVLILISLGALVRIVFAKHVAFTNDEGFYWYDAYALSHRFVAAGDALTKTPVAVLLFSLSQLLSHSWLYADRLVSVLASLLTAWPLYVITKKYAEKQTALWVSAAWLVLAGPTTLLILGHTESVAIFFTTSAFAVSPWAAGIFFVLALATRKSALALVPALIYWLLKTNRRKAWQSLVGAGGVLTVWMLFIFKLYGVGGLQELGGKSSLALIGAKVANQSVDLGGGTFQFAFATINRVAAPFTVLLILNVLALVFTKYRRTTVSSVLAKTGWIWLISTAALYLLWPMTLPDYLAELWLPIVCISTALLASLDLRLRTGVGVLLLLFSTYSLISSYTVPWTGMFTAQSLEVSAGYIRDLVPPGDAILTGAVMAPPLAGYPVFDSIAHPLWYRYSALPTDTKNLFLPPFRDIQTALQQGTVRWILLDELTDYAYLRGTPPLISELGAHWQKMATIPNATGFRSNPLTLWHKLEK